MQRIYTRGLRHYKELSIVVIPCYGCKALPHISHHTYPLSREKLTLSHVNNKGTDQSALPASLMGAFVICSLESIIAKQLNLVHSKLQASIE